jgi:hypothetical protein
MEIVFTGDPSEATDHPDLHFFLFQRLVERTHVLMVDIGDRKRISCTFFV